MKTFLFILVRILLRSITVDAEEGMYSDEDTNKTPFKTHPQRVLLCPSILFRAGWRVLSPVSLISSLRGVTIYPRKFSKTQTNDCFVYWGPASFKRSVWIKKLMNFTIWSDSYNKNNSLTYLIFNCAWDLR